MEDYLVKVLAFGGQIRGYAAQTTEMIQEAQRRHDSWSASTAALGRTMIGTLFLGAMMKGEEKLTVKVQGDGPSGAIITGSDAYGHVKGYIQNPHVALPLNENGKIDVRGAVGSEGVLSVIKDLGLKEAFTGQVPLVSGELGEDFTYYLANSEQVPSAVGLSVLIDTDDSVKAAGGFMIQVMPGASEETIDVIEAQLKDLPLVSSMIEEGKTPEEILKIVLGESCEMEVLETMPVSFRCDCSKEKFAAAIITLGPAEIQSMIEEDHGAEAVCHFCNHHYHYTEKELMALKLEATNGGKGEE